MSARPVSLLIVEDEEDDAELVALELERGGFDVSYRRVETEPDFVSALESRNFDLIISDFAMPNFNGMRAFTLYRSHGIDVPFIFVSGAIGEERAVAAMRAGAKDYILKGKLGRLTAAVERELEEHRNRAQQKESERRSAQEQRRLALAVEASGSGVFEVRLPQGQLSYLTPRCAEVLGFPPDGLHTEFTFGEWIAERAHDDDRASWREAWSDFLAGRKERVRHELRLQREDGSLRWLLALADAVDPNDAGEPTQIVGVILDQTAHRELEQHLARAAKLEAVGRLAGGVAHDFNNMLSVILGHAEMGWMSKSADETSLRHLKMITEAGRRAESLARQLLAYSGRQVLEPVFVAPAEILKSVENLLRPTTKANITIHISSPPTRGLFIDPHLLEQALVNLAVNACDAMPDGGRLEMAVEDMTLSPAEAARLNVSPGDWIYLRVRDSGTGIDKATLERVFEPFFTTKDPNKGTGLGLASVEGFVRQCGGVVKVSSALGVGTTFEIFLPAIEAPSSASLHATRDTISSSFALNFQGSAHVLVVEDLEMVRDLIVEVLTESGHEVLVAASGEEALSLAQEVSRPIDLLLTDLLLPGMNGCDLAMRLADANPDTRIVFMSGYAPDDVQDMNPRALGDAFLTKPIRPRRLLATVNGLLAGPS